MSSNLLQRTAQAAGNGRVYSYAELVEHMRPKPTRLRYPKAPYANLASLAMPGSLEIGGKAYELYSAGGQQIVYAADDQVAKLITRSVSRDRERAEADTNFYTTNYFRALPSAGEHLTCTDFDLRRFKGGIFVTMAMQPRLRALHEFEDINELVAYRDDEAYHAELESLFQAAIALYQDAGLQMDLNGTRNLFLTGWAEEPHIELVDTILVSPEMQAVTDRSGITTGEALAKKLDIIGTVLATGSTQ